MGAIRDIIKAKAINIIVNDDEFLDKVAQEIVNNLDYASIAEEIDFEYSDIADQLDVDEVITGIAQSIDERELADYIDFDYDRVAKEVSRFIDKEQMCLDIVKEIAANI